MKISKLWKKTFVTLARVVNVVKLFTAVSYDFS
jgi:hypothetical protein